MSPTVLRSDGFRFFFYSEERQEPAHLHVRKGEAEGKLWLRPLAWVRHSFTPAQARQAFAVAEHYHTTLLEAYDARHPRQ